MSTVPVRLTVNGQQHEVEVEPRLLLVHLLRDTLALTGTHVGCDTTNCGACTVHLDGDAVKSCTVLAVQADGADVKTIEGMADGDKLHPLQEAFWNDHGLQCGYCTPGMIMAAADLLNRNPNPTEEEVRKGLEGNLCRCTGYHNIVKAVLDAAKAGGGQIQVPAPSAAGVEAGDPVALVIGDDRYAVVDAAEDVLVEYDPLPVVTDPEAALEPGSPLVHEQFGTNKICEWSLGSGDLEAGFAEADVIIERRIVNHRTAGAAIEPRGVVAEWRADRLTVWSSTQVPHFLRLFLSILLGISEDRVRVVAPEVGGAFGSKLNIYAEEIGCAWASRKLNRPVKWIETRSEGMMVTHHGRDQIDYVRVGAKRDGTLTAWHTKIIADIGAYQMFFTPMIPALSAFVMCGIYKTPAVKTDLIDVMTNKFPTDAIRGAGRPEATHMIEVMMDQLADELGMDPLEIRRKNFIAPFTSPHETPIGVAYDSGNYAG